jgi:hypothetical protein
MKNYEVTIKYSKNNLAKYFTCVVKGKKGYYQKAIDIFAKYRVNLPMIDDVWCEGSTELEEGTIVRM